MNTRLKNTMFDLLSYEHLEANWDGYGSIKPLESKIKHSWDGLKMFIDDNLPIPSVMISGDSEISFYYRKKEYNVYIEIEFYDKYFAYLLDQGTEYSGGEDISIREFGESDVYKFLKTLPGSDLDSIDKYYFDLFYTKHKTQDTKD